MPHLWLSWIKLKSLFPHLMQTQLATNPSVLSYLLHSRLNENSREFSEPMLAVSWLHARTNHQNISQNSRKGLQSLHSQSAWKRNWSNTWEYNIIPDFKSSIRTPAENAPLPYTITVTELENCACFCQTRHHVVWNERQKQWSDSYKLLPFTVILMKHINLEMCVKLGLLNSMVYQN